MVTPGGEREQQQRGNPVNPYRDFARRQAQTLGESPEVVKAIVEFTTETFLVDRKIGPPAFHYRQAMKVAKGLSEAEIVHATMVAVDAYNACRAARGEATEAQLEALTPDSVRMWREDAEQKRLAEEAAKRRVLRDRLKQSFERVLEPSDDQLRTKSSNARVDFRTDPVYTALKDRRFQFHSRSLGEEEYQDLDDQINMAKDTLKITIRNGVNVKGLIDSASEALLKNPELRARLGGERFNNFSDLVLRLLEGRQVSAQEIRSAGLDPSDVLKTARVRHANFVLQDIEDKWRTRLDVRRDEIREGLVW